MRLLALFLPVTFLAQAGTTVTNTLVVTASNTSGGPPHGWIGGGAALAVAEDGATTVTLPFTVAPFGVAYDTASITSDGAILFDGALPTGCPSTVESGGGVAVLAGPLQGASVTTRTVGAWPNRTFVVSWNDVRLDGGSATGRFQAWLLEGRPEVVVVHDDVAFAAGGSVRAGGWGDGMGVDWLCDVAPVSGRSAWLADRGVRPSRGTVTSEQLDAPWYGDAALDGSGETIAAGDLNGDDVADLAIGSPTLGAGRIAVVARPEDGSRLDDVPVHVTHPTTGARLGRALAFADLDGDGLDELVAGASQAASNAGVVYVWEDVLARATHDPTTASATWTGPSGSRYGSSLAVGDADGDGVDDVMVGAPAFTSASNALAGSAWLLLGDSGGDWRGARTAATASAFHVEGGSAGEGLGQSIVLVDLDADGDRDAVFGSPFKDIGGEVRGVVSAWVLSPGAPGLVTGTPSWNAMGPVAGGRFGWSLAAGALAGSGGQDVVVGAPYTNMSGANEGRAFLFADPGTTGGTRSPSSAITFETVQDRASARLGQSLAVADVDVDGDDDLVLGAPNETTVASGAGVVYVMRNASWSSIMYVDDADVALEGVHGGASVGAALAAVPETDRTPLFVAAPGDSWGAQNSGSVYTYTWRPDFVDDDGDGQVTSDVGGPDCDDTDPGVLSGAIDLVGDGVDADCDGWRDGRVATRTTVAGWNHDVVARGGVPATFDAVGFEQFAAGASITTVQDVSFSPALTADSVVYGALAEGTRGGKLPLPAPTGTASVTLDFGVPTDVLALSVLDGVGMFTFTATDGAGTTHVAWTQDLDAQDRPGGAFVGMNFSRAICSVTLRGPAYAVHPSFGLDAIRYRDSGAVELYGNEFDDDCDGRIDGGAFVAEDDSVTWEAALPSGFLLQTIDFDAIGEDEAIALQYADRGVTFTPDSGSTVTGAAAIGPVAAFGVRAGDVDGGVTLQFQENQPAVAFTVVGGPGTLAVEGWVDGERVYTRTVTYAASLPTTTAFVGLTFEMPVDEVRIASTSVSFGIDDLRFATLGLDDADQDGYTERQGDCDDADAALSPELVWYLDSDGDGHGVPTGTTAACLQPSGYVALADDCDDSASSVHPVAVEVCDAANVDEDCDGKADDADASVSVATHAVWYADGDADGWGDAARARASCDAPTGFPEPWVAQSGDCANGNAAIHPGAREICDPQDADEDCDGTADDADVSVDPASEAAWFADADGDTYGDMHLAPILACAQPAGHVANDDDCADDDSAVSPGAVEVCDGADQDEDCDGLVDDADSGVSPASRASWYADVDQDGWGDPARVQRACDMPSGQTEAWIARAGDCLDTRGDVSPDGAEVCDAANVDEDCDGTADDADASVAIAGRSAWYVDLDSDGYGDVGDMLAACDAPAGHVAEAGDCDDSDPALSPETVWYADADGDGLGDAAVPQVACVQPSGFVGNDHDCDDGSGLVGAASTWFIDADADGYGDATQPIVACDAPVGTVAVATDCDDEDAAISPLATEVCDAANVDEDCDGVVDDADPGVQPASRSTWYADVDADGFGDPSRDVTACDAPAGHVAQAGDCDDARGDVSPAGTEVCDAADADEDCDGSADDADPSVASASRSAWYADADADGWGDAARVLHACEAPAGLPEAWVATAGDCDEQQAAIHPGALELCDGGDVDEDCDGLVDDLDPSVAAASRVTWYADADADTFGDAAAPRDACDVPAGHVSDATDCDDARGDVHPGGLEVCDALDADEDCDGTRDDADGSVDPASRMVYYADVDADGYGVVTATVLSCDAMSGYAASAGDCDDSDASLSPATPWYRDQDGDGFGDAADSVASCSPLAGRVRTAGDCDDLTSAIHPGAPELCDAADVDEDCDTLADDADPGVLAAGFSTWYGDGDGDGYGDASAPTSACDAPDGYVADALDCDDGDAAITPDTAWYEDLDGDGHGDPAAPWGALTCTRPSGFVVADDDCDPADPDVHPGAAEVCNGTDDDCDSRVDDADADVIGLPWYADADADGYGDPTLPPVAACVQPAAAVADASDCDDAAAGVHPGATEVCDAADVDEDCDGTVEDDDSSLDSASRLTWYRDVDSDGHGDETTTARACAAPSGHVALHDDCDDTRASIHPGASEVCDAADVDEDCDGLRDDADPGVLSAGFVPFYADLDRDGFGDAGASMGRCDAADGWLVDSTDCDDTDAGVNPGATEACDAFDVDEDCDGTVDDADANVDADTYLTWYADVDGDAYGDRASTAEACAAPVGFVADDTDCDDGAAAVHPGAQEICDAADVDEDCDGSADDTDPSVRATGFVAWHVDADGDSFGDPVQTVGRCDVAAGLVADATDCDDADVTVNPAATERCDALDVDEDCDGDADDSDADVEPLGFATWYADADGDGWGDASATRAACDAPAAHVDDATDCDDARSDVHPGAMEVCDAADVDEDCDAAADDADLSVADASRSAWYGDADGDGFGAASAGTRACAQPSGHVADSSDCDDARAAVHPGAPEVCDADDRDEDCDGRSDDADADVDPATHRVWYVDIDADGFGRSGQTTGACERPSGYADAPTDCDDARSDVHPGAAELCDAGDVDEDCDGRADDTDPDVVVSTYATWFADVDADGWGDAASTQARCDVPAGFVAKAGDCDDAAASVSPDAPERCDGDDVDEDCDGTADDADDSVDADGFVDWYRDADADGWGDGNAPEAACDVPDGHVAVAGDCDDSDVATHPDTVWFQDADADGFGDAGASELVQCARPEGYVRDATDCDDARAAVHPGATEVCDAEARDEDCNGLADDADSGVLAASRSTWYQDGDADGYGLSSRTTAACVQPVGHVARALDCDDARGTVHPGATDAPYDGIDADCGGQDDFDADGDGVTPVAYGGMDCDDTNRAVRPGATDFPYDGVDADCDGADDYDRDGDGFVVAWYGGVDCNDTDPTVGPGAIDPAYDGVDSNCDGADEYDVDGDGWDASEAGGADCDDGDATVHPGASDAPGDGVDADCDGTDPVGGTCPDCDGDGYASGADCDDADPAVHPGATDAPYDGRDVDCASDDDYDADHDGVRASAYGGTDCDDTDAARHPGVTSDGCGRGDEDCDGTTDEDCVIAPADTGSDTGTVDTGADTGGSDTGRDTDTGDVDTGSHTPPATTTEPETPVEVPRGVRGCATAPGAPNAALALAALCIAFAARRRTNPDRKDIA